MSRPVGSVELTSREILPRPRGHDGKLDVERVSEIRLRSAKGHAACRERAKYANTSAQNVACLVSHHPGRHLS
jgi:hypothetical protein